MTVHVRRLKSSWGYDFKIAGHPRQRKAGFPTKASALAAGQRRLDELGRGMHQTTLAEMYESYLAANRLALRTLDAYDRGWRLIEPVLGHLLLENVDTEAIDAFKQTLPPHLAPTTVNQYLALLSAVLHFARTRGRLRALPYVPKAKVPHQVTQWYTAEERDRLVSGMFKFRPGWYLFFYLSTRLGLRVGEVYALTRRQVGESPSRLVIDQAAVRGTSTRPAIVKPVRKGNDSLVLYVPEDVMDAIRWHITQGYAGPEFLFSADPTLPRYLESHKRPLLHVQKKLGLRRLSHHKIGRHSVGGQAMTAGLSPRVLQAQLGHRSPQSTARYANIASDAQRHLVDLLTPKAPPHTSSTGVDRH